MLRTGDFWEDLHPVPQQVRSMRATSQASNAERRMTAMRNRNQARIVSGFFSVVKL
jgi:hypothetical protein